MKPGTIQQLQEKLDMPTLQTRRKTIRLVFMFKVVEGLMPAMPPSKFIKLQKNQRIIRPRRDPNFSYKNRTIDNLIRNNDRSIDIPTSTTDQKKFSFFPRTAAEWNRLDNTVVHAKSPDQFRTLLEKQLD